MAVRDVVRGYAASKTAWGGLLLYLLSLGNIATEDGGHTFGLVVDGVVYQLPLHLSGLFAALATAAFGLLLYGRGKARGPLLAAALRQAADCLETGEGDGTSQPGAEAS